MTTIAWDGKELVADTRLTLWVQFSNGRRNEYRHDCDAMVKIIPAHPNLYFNYQPVEAMAVSGDDTMLLRLRAYPDRLLAVHDKCDLGWAGWYQEGSPFYTADDFNFLVITAEHVYVVRFHNKQVTHEQYPRNSFVTVGSGAAAFADIPGVTMTARHAVRLASMCDKHTGGNLSVWKDGILSTGVKPPSMLTATTAFYKAIWQFCTQQKKFQKMLAWKTKLEQIASSRFIES